MLRATLKNPKPPFDPAALENGRAVQIDLAGHTGIEATAESPGITKFGFPRSRPWRLNTPQVFAARLVRVEGDA